MLIRNGLAVLEGGACRADIRVTGEAIEEIGEGLAQRPGETVLDAEGKIVLPGGVDVHTHMDLDLGTVRATDDFYTGTVAAAFGGTTTIVDHMAFGSKDAPLRHQLDVYHGLADGKAVIDYGFHGVISQVTSEILEELPRRIHDGITSHKIYLTYAGKLEDRDILRLLETTRELGLMLCVHAENDGAVEYLREKYRAAGKTEARYHPLSRPPECEAEAVGRMAYFARMAGDAPLYIVHLSSWLGLQALRHARRDQRHIYAETCPQYLFLEDSLYDREDGLKFILSPPLRKRKDIIALRRAVSEGTIQTVATDHCPFFYTKEKQLGKSDFTKAPGGAGGVEARMGLLYTLVARGGLSLTRLVSACCTNPAKLFGLYPKKGVLAPGSDADIVLIDPNLRATLTHEMLHENTDYTPYEGQEIRGWPITTIARGKVLVQEGRFLGEKGYGRFLWRGLPQLL